MAAEEDHDDSHHHGSFTARKIHGRPWHGTELGIRYRCENIKYSPYSGSARQLDLFLDQARHVPLLRANPYSEVTDPICRFPLPTLVYRLEALYLGDLLGIWVRTGATCGFFLDFQGPRGRSRHRKCEALRFKHYFPARDFQETRTLIQKRKLFPDLLTATPGHFGLYPDEHSYEGSNVCDSVAGFRNRNRIFFRSTCVCFFSRVSQRQRDGSLNLLPCVRACVRVCLEYRTPKLT